MAVGSSSSVGDPLHRLSSPNKACADELPLAYPSMLLFSLTNEIQESIEKCHSILKKEVPERWKQLHKMKLKSLS
jgi:hypothetical protein